MVNEEVIISTIKRMMDSGIDDSIRQYLDRVKGIPVQKQQAAQIDGNRGTQELLHTMTHNKLEEHSDQLNTVQQSVSDLHEKVNSLSQGPSNNDLASQLALLNQKISDIEKQISDLKAMTAASKSLLEKILETNRKIVEKL